jgi:undecaprenyl-diphosphatase
MIVVACLLAATVPDAALAPAPETTLAPAPVAAPVPAPQAALAPTPFAARVRDTASIIAWPLSLGFRSAPAVAAIAVGALLMPQDVPLYRFFERKIRWTLSGESVFDATVHLGDGLFDLAVVGAFALGDSRARRTSLEGVEALISVAATSVVLKHVFRVARPSSDPDRKTYFGRFSHDAFPSGHTMSAFATATVIAAEYPRAAPYAYAVATLVGVSVIKRRWHWPSDVIAGAAIGYLIGRASIEVNARHLSVGLIPAGINVGGDF